MQYLLICENPASVLAAFAGNNERRENEMIHCFYTHYGTRVKEKVLRWYGNPHNETDVKDTEDAFQEALIHLVCLGRANQLTHTLAQPASIMKYLFIITRNKYLNVKKGATRRMVILQQVAKGIDVSADDTADDQKTYEWNQDTKLTACFESLRPNCRELLHLIYFQRKKIKEVAADREQTVSYLYTELSRCREALRNCVQQYPVNPN
jgi:RNA polymerase sigma factor (sigma-70 family)